ncbi:S1 RNA binding domain containing protein [Klebsormidium nitens]|uniref:S1 RNA binding domain containing protein n=1 Tax=Klebsormidium nitens TaxID=105231 RepID=A0A0U9HIM2_KLENI|nr:S1 RNA binding domain containing protein [Klebsormidium nitens]|eukprot:GAQ80445.1 S1 RNA binding domain containing protein [Klebsormidium nitens]
MARVVCRSQLLNAGLHLPSSRVCQRKTQKLHPLGALSDRYAETECALLRCLLLRRPGRLSSQSKGARCAAEVQSPAKASESEGDGVQDSEKVAVKRVPKASQQQVNQRAKDSDWKSAQQLFESGELVSAKVEGANNGGVLIKLGSLLGFVPFSQIRSNDGTKSLSEVGASLVGKTITAKVIEVNRKAGRFVLSEKLAAWIEAAQQLTVDEVREGRVDSLTDFGAFVDIKFPDGSYPISGLVHTSELSWDPVHHPEDLLTVGQEVRVKVVNVDMERMRLALSLKQLENDPLLETLDTIMPAGYDDDLTDDELAVLPLPGLEDICNELQKEDGVLSVALGRQAVEKRVVSQDLELWLSNAPAENGYTLLARAGRQVQEVMVETTLDREAMKAAIQRVTTIVP